MPEVRVSPRERLVLTAIIELYIATGEPVASQAVAQYFANKRRTELGDNPQRDGDAGRRGNAGAAAHFRGTRSDGRGVSLLRGTDHAGGGAMDGWERSEWRPRAAIAIERSAARTD